MSVDTLTASQMARWLRETAANTRRKRASRYLSPEEINLAPHVAFRLEQAAEQLDGAERLMHDIEAGSAELLRLAHENADLRDHLSMLPAVEPTPEPDYRHLYQCEVASKAVLQCETDSLKADLHAMLNSAETLEALKTAHQALLEVAHAQDVGPEWYTRGTSALRQQVAMWVKRGLDALNKARPSENRPAEPT